MCSTTSFAITTQSSRIWRKKRQCSSKIDKTGIIDIASRTFCYRDSISFIKCLIQEYLGGRELDNPASIDSISLVFKIYIMTKGCTLSLAFHFKHERELNVQHIISSNPTWLIRLKGIISRVLDVFVFVQK